MTDATDATDANVEPDARAIAQFVLAELRRAGEDLMRAQRQIGMLVQADDLREALRERLIADPLFDRALREAQRRADRDAFPSDDDLEAAAAAIWKEQFPGTGHVMAWDQAPEWLRVRPLRDARAVLACMKDRMATRP